MSSQPNAQVAADARVHHDDDLSWKTAVAALRPTVRSSLFPGKYVQGPGALARAPELIASLLPEGARAKAYLMWNKRTHVKEILESNHVECVANCLEGENTSATVLEHVAISKRSACNVLVGVGGGKLIDCAKAIAHYCDIPCVICPTIASTDAPCSALSIIYDRNGTVESILHLRRNPDIVIVDTEVIVMAPPKTLVAGIGDALATWFEAESCMVKQAPNCGPGGLRGTLTAYTLARCCYKTLLKYAVAAVESNKRHCIVEANTLLSGLGFESAGLATAHAIHNGLSVLSASFPHNDAPMHGQKVAIGLLASMFLTNKPPTKIDQIYAFCESVGLPTTLADIGLPPLTNEQLQAVANKTCLKTSSSQESIWNEPYTVNPQVVIDCIKRADAHGRARKSTTNSF